MSEYHRRAEAKCRHAMLLEASGREAEAVAVFEDVLRGAEAADPDTVKANREWIERAYDRIRAHRS